MRFRLILYEYLCQSKAVGEGHALELVGVFERDFYACAYWNEWPGLRITALSFWRFSLLTTGPVLCGIARGDADEHFVRRNPKECVLRWRVFCGGGDVSDPEGR